MVEIENLIKCGETFLDMQEGSKDNILFSRYKSWEFCYIKFTEIARKDNIKDSDYDNLALNLAFYLASYGMYRGSCFLLQNNYQIHKEPVKEIITFMKNNNLNEKIEWEKLNPFINKLIDYYQSKKYYDNNIPTCGHVTDTLITKILLGTTGVVPAYDTNLKDTLGKLGITKSFGKNSYDEIWKFYKENEKVFNKLAMKAKKISGIDYPKMKLLDICLWEYYR